MTEVLVFLRDPDTMVSLSRDGNFHFGRGQIVGGLLAEGNDPTNVKVSAAFVHPTDFPVMSKETMREILRARLDSDDERDHVTLNLEDENWKYAARKFLRLNYSGGMNAHYRGSEATETLNDNLESLKHAFRVQHSLDTY